MDLIALFAKFGPFIFPVGFIALLVLTLIWQVILRSGKLVIKKPPLTKRHFAVGLTLMIIGYTGEFVNVVLLTISSENQYWLIAFVFGIVGIIGLVNVLKLKNVWAKALIGFLIIFGIFVISWFITVIVAPLVFEVQSAFR